MRGNNYFLDTNIFIRAAIKDDRVKTPECERLFELIGQGVMKARTSNLVLAEFVWTLKSFYHVQRQDIVRLADGIASMKNLQIQERFHTLNALEYYRKLNVKFVDVLLASDSFFKNRNACIVSYDRDFDSLGILRREPGDVIQDLTKK